MGCAKDNLPICCLCLIRYETLYLHPRVCIYISSSRDNRMVVYLLTGGTCPEQDFREARFRGTPLRDVVC